MFKNLRKIFVFLILIISLFSNVYSDEKLINDLKKGEKFIFIRHAIAPGSGDPENFKLDELAANAVELSCVVILPLKTKGSAASPIRPIAIGKSVL